MAPTSSLETTWISLQQALLTEYIPIMQDQMTMNEHGIIWAITFVCDITQKLLILGKFA